jgi:hypothetical protein
MLSVNECVLEPQEMMVVVFVQLGVELDGFSIERGSSGRVRQLTRSKTDTSIILWLKYAVRFLITLTATTS